MTRKEMNEPLHFLQQLKGGGEVNISEMSKHQVKE